MRRVRVKVCGLREPAKAATIAKCGADAIGMVFADSPRWVSVDQARDVADAIPPLVARVGVFVNAQPVLINRVASKVGLNYAQLHGDEAPEIVEHLDCPVIKAFRIRDESWLGEVRRWLDGVANRSRVQAVLLDAFKKDVYGGTGEQFNWELVTDARLAGAMKDLPPIILSGGLNNTNVITAIRAVEPWAVDVSSGVETAPGVKDVDKANRFIISIIDDVGELTSEFWR